MTTWIVEEYRARIEEWIEAGIGTVTSADELYEILRETEYYAPRRIVREEWAEHVRTGGYIPLINRLPDTDYVPRSWVQETGASYRDNYAVKIKLTGLDAITGKEMERYITLEYGSLPQKIGITQDAADFLYWYNFDLEPGKSQLRIERILHQRGMPW